MRIAWWIGLMVLVLTACGGGGNGSTTSPSIVASTPVVEQSQPTQEPPPPEDTGTVAPLMSGNARHNPACKLLTIDQVSAAAGLDVVELLGLPSAKANPDKRSESCTWYLDSEIIQGSLVVQYTLYAQPPAELVAYYPQVVDQGIGKFVPHLGTISKIDDHALDTIYGRAEIHVVLLMHAEATHADQKAAIALMRLVMAGIHQ